MALLSVQYQSNFLRKTHSMWVILPDSTRGRYPVMYLLHGSSNNHTTWCRRTRIEWFVRDLPLAVVMPDGERSYYCDAVSGFRHESHIMNEVIKFVDTHFNTIADRSGRVIGGASMGGYGALKLALKFPDMFCSALSHSGAVGAGHKIYDDPKSEFRLIYGENPIGGKDDLWAIAEKADRSKLPAIYMTCGLEDGLLKDNRVLHEHLNKLEIPHEYKEVPGSHNWDLWNSQLEEAIQFQIRALQIP